MLINPSSPLQSYTRQQDIMDHLYRLPISDTVHHQSPVSWLLHITVDKAMNVILVGEKPVDK